MPAGKEFYRAQHHCVFRVGSLSISFGAQCNAHNARYVYSHDAYSYEICGFQTMIFTLPTSAKYHISVNKLAMFHCAKLSFRRLRSLKTAKLLNGVDVVWSL